MRIVKVIPKNGTTRTIEKFLFLPVTVYVNQEDGSRIDETRWLTKAKIEQKYTKGRRGAYWVNKRFL